MKLVLVNVYPRGTIARYLLSSYVLTAYLDEYYDGNRLDVEVLNASENVEPEGLFRKLIDRTPDIIGYSCYIWNMEKILRTVAMIKERREAIVQVLGGPEISVQSIPSLPSSARADYYIIGEGEIKLLDLVRYIYSKKSGVKGDPPEGVTYWKDGAFKYSDGRTGNIATLDTIPSVYLTGIIDDSLCARQLAFLETQRGCPYRCSYCVYRRYSSSIRYYSKERIYKELDHLIVNKRVAALRFIDPIFTSDLGKAKEIVRHIALLKKRKGLKLPWIYWEFDHSGVDEEFIALVASLKYRKNILNVNKIPPLDRPQLYSDMLKDYTAINSIGIESLYPPALKAVKRRPVDIGKFGVFMKMVTRYNIAVKLDVILGLPHETVTSYFEGLEAILPYFKETDHILNIHRLQVLPGSELESSSEAYGIAYSAYAPHLVISTHEFTQEGLDLTSKLSALLSRILNSPLRKLFFETRKHQNGDLAAFLKGMLEEMTLSGQFRKAALLSDRRIDDEYWNNDIYKEIPSRWLADYLKR